MGPTLVCEFANPVWEKVAPSVSIIVHGRQMRCVTRIGLAEACEVIRGHQRNRESPWDLIRVLPASSAASWTVEHVGTPASHDGSQETLQLFYESRDNNRLPLDICGF